jgi:conjugal transfer/entry exclusion protein
MMRRAIACVLVLLALAPTVGAATLPVVDVTAIANLITAYKLQIQQYLEQLRHTQNQIRQLQNQIQQIQHAYTTVQHGIANLQKLNMNKASDLLQLVQQLQSKLTQAEYIGYTVDRAWTQAKDVYPKAQGIVTGVQQRQMAMQWAAAKRDAAKVGVQTQAIKTAQEKYQQQWADIIAAARAAEGNMQVQQAQAQGQAVMGNQLLSIEQQLATAARQDAQKALEEATKTEMEQLALEHSTATFDTAYFGQGQVLRMSRTGRENP